MSNARKSSPRARSEDRPAGGMSAGRSSQSNSSSAQSAAMVRVTGGASARFRLSAFEKKAGFVSELCAIPFRSWRKGRVCRPVVSLPWTSWGLVPQPFPRLTVS